MSYYAQRNYTQELGSGQYTIAQAGSLLTAFCNLLQRYGVNMDPPQLDSYFREHNGSLHSGRTAYGDLSWASVTAVDKLLAVGQVGSTDIPTSPDTILKFHYQSVDTPMMTVDGKQIPNMVDHFCAIDRIQGGQVFIVDSWDGMVKGSMTYERVYGKPVTWAAYVKHVPVPAPQVTAKAPAGAVTAPPRETIKIIHEIPGYATALLALAHGSTPYRVASGVKYKNQVHESGMVNVGSEYGRPGFWINPRDNTLDVPAPVPAPTAPKQPPAPVPAHSATPQTTVTETEQAAAPDWRATYKPLPKQPSNFYAIKTFVYEDLEGKQPDVICHKFDLAPLAGTYVGPDRKTLYGRTMRSTFPHLRKTPREQALPPFWYGLPMKSLMSEEEVWSTQTDIVTRFVTNNLSLRDHLAIAIGRLSGWFERFGKQTDVTRK